MWLTLRATRELREFIAAWREISERDVSFGLRQKGVDMRIGLDIARMTLKHRSIRWFS
jgi:hypothetical protein